MFTEAAILDLRREADRAAYKREEFNKLSLARSWSVGNATFEVVDFGIERGALASRIKLTVDGRRYSLGKREVTIENVRIYSPRVKVSNGFDAEGNQLFRFDPLATYQQVLARNILALARKPINVDKEVIGRTAHLIYSTGGNGPSASSIDGHVGRAAGGSTWSSLRNGAGTTVSMTSTSLLAYLLASSGADQYSTLYRWIASFDTSGIFPDIVLSAILFIYGSIKANSLGEPRLSISDPAPAALNNLTSEDFNIDGSSWLTTEFGAVSYADFLTAAFNEITLNEAGRLHVDTNGVTAFGGRLGFDFDNTTPTHSPSGITQLSARSTDQSGTAQDISLLIESGSAPSSGGRNQAAIIAATH